MQRINHVFILAGALVLSAPALAEIYKWTDADGETHYSERKPDAATPVETLQPRNVNPLADRETVEARSEAADEQAQSAAEQATKAAEATADADYDERYCQSWRDRLASLERPRVNKVADDGTRTRMSEEWRQEKLAEARATIAKSCQ